MAEITEIINGELKLTTTPDVTIITITKDEIIDKRAEAQTKVDHLNIDLIAAQAEVTKWDDYLNRIDKK